MSGFYWEQYWKKTNETIPVSSRSSQPLSWRHQAPSRRAQRPLCSGPLPSCCQHRSDRKQNCLAWRSGRRVPTWLSPWYRAPGPPGWHGEHICHQMLRCSKRWSSLVGGLSLRGMLRWGQFHAHLRLFPRTKTKTQNYNMLFCQSCKCLLNRNC